MVSLSSVRKHIESRLDELEQIAQQPHDTDIIKSALEAIVANGEITEQLPEYLESEVRQLQIDLKSTSFFYRQANKIENETLKSEINATLTGRIAQYNHFQRTYFSLLKEEASPLDISQIEFDNDGIPQQPDLEQDHLITKNKILQELQNLVGIQTFNIIIDKFYSDEIFELLKNLQPNNDELLKNIISVLITIDDYNLRREIWFLIDNSINTVTLESSDVTAIKNLNSIINPDFYTTLHTCHSAIKIIFSDNPSNFKKILLMDQKRLIYILYIMDFYISNPLEKDYISLEDLLTYDVTNLKLLKEHRFKIMKYRKHYANFNAFMKDAKYFEMFFFSYELIDLLLTRKNTFEEIKHALGTDITNILFYNLHLMIIEGFSLENFTSITTSEAKKHILMNHWYIIFYKQKHPEMTPDAIIKKYNAFFDLLIERKVSPNEIEGAINIGVINHHFYYLHLMIIEGFSFKSFSSNITHEEREYLLKNHKLIILYKQKHPEMTPDAIIKKHLEEEFGS
jgi:hypothetical protein